jgi:hypothetical protein
LTHRIAISLLFSVAIDVFRVVGAARVKVVVASFMQPTAV